MGVDYFLVSDEHEERFALGRGPWHECAKQPCVEELGRLAFNIAEDRGASRSEARRWACSVARWAEERGKVRILSDADEDYESVRDYKETGSDIGLHEMTREDIRRMLEVAADSLREKLGADVVEIFCRMDECYSKGDLYYWQYGAISGDTEQSNGYKLQKAEDASRVPEDVMEESEGVT